MFLAIYTDICF